MSNEMSNESRRDNASQRDNEYELPVWEHPDFYVGFNPEGDFVLAVHTRDSAVLEQSNFENFKDGIEEIEETLPAPTTVRHTQYNWVYSFTASHWGVGWVEYLMLRGDAPDALQVYAYETLAALADYPVLNDEDLSEREEEKAQEYYDFMSDRDKLDYLRRNDISIFAVRRDFSEIATADLIADLNTD